MGLSLREYIFSCWLSLPMRQYPQENESVVCLQLSKQYCHFYKMQSCKQLVFYLRILSIIFGTFQFFCLKVLWLLRNSLVLPLKYQFLFCVIIYMYLPFICNFLVCGFILLRFISNFLVCDIILLTLKSEHLFCDLNLILFCMLITFGSLYYRVVRSRRLLV